jgi:hypothetical protein
MTEQPPTAIGTVAQEAARLIEDMATMARATHSRADDPHSYAAEQASRESPQAAGRVPDSEGDAGERDDREASDREAGDRQAGDRRAGDRQAGDRQAGDRQAGNRSSTGVCSVCGADGDSTPASCQICPLCRGIALLRSVRPETVDLLADLALSVAAGLRDVAARTRTSAPEPPSRPQPGSQPEGERTTVQDIPVDDESE